MGDYLAVLYWKGSNKELGACLITGETPYSYEVEEIVNKYKWTIPKSSHFPKADDELIAKAIAEKLK